MPAYLIVLLVISGLLFFRWLCSFAQEIAVKVIVPPFGRLVVAYKYNTRATAESEGRMVRLLRHTHRQNEIPPSFKTFVVNYTEDKKVSVDAPASYATGVILNEEGIIPDYNLRMALHELGYKFAMFPKISSAVVATYKYVNLISIQLGKTRVYPKLLRYIEHRKLCAHPAIEIYDNEAKVMTFMIPLARQFDFYVPEAVPEVTIDSDTASNASTATG